MEEKISKVIESIEFKYNTKIKHFCVDMNCIDSSSYILKLEIDKNLYNKLCINSFKQEVKELIIINDLKKIGYIDILC